MDSMNVTGVAHNIKVVAKQVSSGNTLAILNIQIDVPINEITEFSQIAGINQRISRRRG